MILIGDASDKVIAEFGVKIIRCGTFNGNPDLTQPGKAQDILGQCHQLTANARSLGVFGNCKVVYPAKNSVMAGHHGGEDLLIIWHAGNDQAAIVGRNAVFDILTGIADGRDQAGCDPKPGDGGDVFGCRGFELFKFDARRVGGIIGQFQTKGGWGGHRVSHLKCLKGSDRSYAGPVSTGLSSVVAHWAQEPS